MITLGIESTAHTFGVGVLKDNEIISNEKMVFSPTEGGIIPREAMDHHFANANEIYLAALKSAKIDESKIDLVAFSQGPGLAPCLRVGGFVSRYLAQKLDVPIMGVNHCIAHIDVGKELTKMNDPITLYVSGGNTQIIGLEAMHYRVFGETLDIAIGNCLDQFARRAGIPFPGGPKIEKLASKSNNLLDLPYTVKGMDFSFSGIMTASTKLLESEKLEDICFSLQETAFAELVEATERAMAHTEKKECMLTGGVAANKKLQGMLKIMCEERGAKFDTVPMKYAGDNGAMIGMTGYKMFKAGIRHKISETTIQQRFRTDEVKVSW
ncbi:bifunctional N(6)-L-threonylcarbamoyladenine synthase/serine/threonine protein kinase [Candidatus Undinarchaeota archaeon]